MKITRENVFTNALVKIKKWASGINLDTIWGKIENFFWGDIDYDIDDIDYDEEFVDEEEYEEAKNAIYHISINDVIEYTFVLTLLQAGYTVLATTSSLTEYEKEQFRKKLQVELFKQGIYCHKVNSDNFVIAPSSVEIVDFEEPKQEPGKIIYLSNYRKK